VSSIRLFILGSLDERGPMHGHQLRLLAEQEHVNLWTDITVGSLYGAIKRLAAEGLIVETRVEREGAYPERQVWQISEAGLESLRSMRFDGLRTIVIKPDPFDLALTKLDTERLDALPETVRARIAALDAMIADAESHRNTVDEYLTKVEKFVMGHKTERLRTEVAWHTELLEQLPDIIADERARKDSPDND
jgi:DNA-binding PadR family transcriptional regulator